MFEKLYNQLRRVFHEHRVGIYTTISIHLVVIIVFLLYNINNLRFAEMAFLIDFSKQEEKIAREEKDQRRKDFEKELEKTLTDNRRNHELRNVAVDKSDNVLRDDRHQNPSSIYEEHKQVQARLDASRLAAQQQQGGDVAPVAVTSDNNAKKAETYKGPSVLSYDLGGRKAMRLPVPVYQCQGGGDVTVMIEVDRRGYVVSMIISATSSVDNTCLQEAAKRAAQTSRFAADASAPERQKGHIVYRFIAQ
ncbi:MAG: hypothetical protein FWH23_03915 [Bacteroidales bacterium]|nr:hypothetical protein [Bacteroidales bacterium]